MPTPFDELALKDVEEKIPDADAQWLKANERFYRGDHWQSGNGWSGPMLEAGHELYQEIFLEIQRAFVSKNTVAEIVDRHTAGVIGREPMWNLTVARPLAEGEEPTAGEQILIDEAEALLTNWWDDREAHKILQDAAAACLWARRGALRLFVPPGLMVDGLIPKADLQTSVGKIYLDQPEPSQATVDLDRKTMRKVGIYLYEEDRAKKAELVYLDETGKLTVMRIIGTETAEVEQQPVFSLDFGGKLTIYEMSRPRLVTDQVIQNQKLLNLALTMLQRNVITAGFLERTFFNTQLPGRDIDDPDRPGEKLFVPEQLHVGAGATNFFSGVVVTDVNGNEVIASPSVVYRDPVPVVVFRDTKQEAYRNILEECRQIHAIISGDAVASGESRKQALVDFEQSLQDTKNQLENAIRWLLETVLAMAATFSGQTGRYAGLRATANCRLELGPISADDQRVAKELAEAKIISRETAMSRVGVDDTDAEQAKVEAEQETDSQRQQQTLATAVLNAQRGLAGGQQSNGLEQPVAAEEEE